MAAAEAADSTFDLQPDSDLVVTIDDAESEYIDSFAYDAEDLNNVLSCEADHMPGDAAEQMGFVRLIPPPSFHH